jgi:hypothetical protein
MTSMKKMARVLALAAAVGAGFVAKAEAIPIISLNPSSATVTTGDSVAVDVVLSNLDEVTGGFFLVLSFDNTIFTAVSATSGAALGATLDFSDLSGVSSVSLDFASLETVGVLTGLQGPFPSNIVLGTVNFDAIADGTGNFGVVAPVDVSNGDGSALIPVCIEGQPCGSVPEPGLLALLGTGLATLVVRRRARREQ